MIAELRGQPDQAQATILQLKQLTRAQGRYSHEEITLTSTQRKVVDILLQADEISTEEHLYETLYTSSKQVMHQTQNLREIIRLVPEQVKSHGIEITFSGRQGLHHVWRQQG